MARPRLRLILDFDDTITVGGVGDFLIEDLGDGTHRALWDRYLAGAMTLKDLDALQYPLIRANREELARYACEKAVIRPGFQELLAFCEAEGAPVAVITGGLEEYAKPVLANHGAGHLPVYGNRAVFGGPSGHIVATDMPNASPVPEFCDYCATCKTLLIDRIRQPGEEVAYAGDGSTDFCPVTFADHVFARRRLLDYCRERGIPHTPFETFHEVREGLASILSRGP